MQAYAPHALVLFASVILQTTVMPHFRIMGSQPDLVLIVTITFAFLEGPAFGSATGFLGGLLQDLAVTRVVGLSALSKTMVGYMAGQLERTIFTESIFLPIISIFIATLVNETIYVGFSYLFGNQIPVRFVYSTLVLPAALYNSILALFVFPLLRRLVYYRHEVAVPK
jgi:rod shape-determining protein MreD